MSKSFSGLPTEIRQDILLRVIEPLLSPRIMNPGSEASRPKISNHLGRGLCNLASVDKQTAVDVQHVAAVAAGRAARDYPLLLEVEAAYGEKPHPGLVFRFLYRKTQDLALADRMILIWQIRRCEKEVTLPRDPEMGP